MSSRPATDPTSWRFQAGIHGYNKQTDPFVNAGPVPKKAVQDKFWKKCQHGSWFFLPWHRMYLGFFEQIVRAAVVKLGGPAGWALPYWNYSDASNPQAKALPPAFRELKLPDGSPNPLFVIQGANILRAPGINAGHTTVIPNSDVDLSGCLAETFFSPSTDITSHRGQSQRAGIWAKFSGKRSTQCDSCGCGWRVDARRKDAGWVDDKSGYGRPGSHLLAASCQHRPALVGVERDLGIQRRSYWLGECWRTKNFMADFD
jgi:hypothetical protein